MDQSIKIIIYEKAKSFLISREAVDMLFDSIKTSNTDIELDFSNIEFMSRSYADQLHKLKLDFENEKNIKIYIVNANEEIINMLHAVSKTQNKRERNFDNVPVFKFSKSKPLTDYLLSI